MGLQLILGGNRSDKTTFLYERLCNQSIENPKEQYYLVVPEQFTMQATEDLLAIHKRHALLSIDVLSFHRLAYRIFEEVGSSSKVFLDEEGKLLLLRKIMLEKEKELTVLGRSVRTYGFVEEIKSVLSELMQYQISIEALQEMAHKKEGTAFGAKLKDLSCLYQGYCEALQDTYYTMEEVLVAAAGKIKEAKKLLNATVYLHGFTGFTPVQLLFIRELLGNCKEVIVSVTYPSLMASKAAPLFRLSKQTITSLMQLAKEAKTQVNEPIVIPEERESVFSKVEQYYIGTPWKGKEDATGNIQIVRTKTMLEECTLAMDTIRYLVRNKGYRYRDIAVICGEEKIYGGMLKELGKKYEVPLFMDQKRSILLNPLVEWVRSLLSVCENHFSSQEVIRLLRTGLLAPDFFKEEAVDLLENYLRAHGIWGWKNYLTPFPHMKKGWEGERQQVVEILREQLVEQMQEFMQAMEEKHLTAKKIGQAIKKMMDSCGVKEQLDEQAAVFFQEQQWELAAEYEQIYDTVIEIIDKMEALLGDEEMSTNEFANLLEGSIASTSMGMIPMGADQVLVGDLKRTRLGKIKVILLVGGTDSYIPGNLRKEGLITEREREVLRENHLELAPGVKEEVFIQKFYLYLLLTKPEKELYIFYSQMNAQGKSMGPAYFIEELKRQVPSIVVKTEEDFPNRELTPSIGLEELAKEKEKVREQALQSVLKQVGKEEKVMLLQEAKNYHNPKERLLENTAKALYESPEKIGVTRLETFSQCAYAHYLRYGLSLQEREEYGYAYLDYGNLVHSALHRLFMEVKKDGLRFESLSKEEMARRVEEATKWAILEADNFSIRESKRYSYLAYRSKDVISKNVDILQYQQRLGEFTTVATEVPTRSGRVDRLDVCATNDALYFQIVDYKTGAKCIDLIEMYNGIQLQLLLYLNEMEEKIKTKYKETVKEIIPAGAGYYQVKTPRLRDTKKIEENRQAKMRMEGIVLKEAEPYMGGDGKKIFTLSKGKGTLNTQMLLSRSQMRHLQGFAIEKVKGLQQAIIKGDISVAPYQYQQKTACDYCPYKGVCHFDPSIPGYDYRKLSSDIPLQEMLGEEENNDTTVDD